MLGASRDSIARQSQALDARRTEAGFAGLADALYAVADLLGDQTQLRNALADAGQPVPAREGLVRELLGSRVSPLALEVLVGVVG